TDLNRARGTTMMVSTHDLNLAASLCSELVLIREGRIVAQGATDAVLTTANIRALYDVDAEVGYNARAGHVTVVPIARARRSAPPAARDDRRLRRRRRRRDPVRAARRQHADLAR